MRVLLVLLLLGCVEKEIITKKLDESYCLYKKAPISTNGQNAGKRTPSELVDCFVDPYYRPPSGYEGYLRPDCNCPKTF
jgi:hypothetical protein